MSEQGFVSLHRCLMDKPIWLNSTPEQKVVLITLLMMANHKPKEWEWMGEKFEIKPGEFITSLDSIVLKSGKGISKQNVRSALVRFEKLQFLTNKSTKRGRLLKIVNWRVFQDAISKPNIVTNKEVTKTQQRGNKEVTPNNNDNNDNNDNNAIIKNHILSSEVSEIVDFLNLKAKKSFKKNTRKTISVIQARINEGFTVDDFKTVIAKKTTEWESNPKMNQFLRPETLFGTKFEGYLNQAEVKPDNVRTESVFDQIARERGYWE